MCASSTPNTAVSGAGVDGRVRSLFGSDPSGAFRALGVVIVGGVIAAPVLAGVGPLCPLRRATGVPCPFCGLRGGVTALVEGDVVSSLAHSPLAVMIVVAVALAWFGGVLRMFGSASRLARNWQGSVPGRLQAAVAGVSWVFQLHRYGYLS